MFAGLERIKAMLNDKPELTIEEFGARHGHERVVSSCWPLSDIPLGQTFLVDEGMDNLTRFGTRRGRYEL